MPLLDITRTRPCLQIYPGTLTVRSLIAGKAFCSSFSFRNDMRSFSPWKSLNLPIKLHDNVGSFEIRRGRVFVRAVATFKTKKLVKKQDERKGSDDSLLKTDSSPRLQPKSGNEDSEETEEREQLRRNKISKANKGRVPRNKGRKHNAVVTIKTKSLAKKQDERKGSDGSRLGIDSSPRLQPESGNEDSEEMEERKQLRRNKISKANKGRVPRKKGRKHSAVATMKTKSLAKKQDKRKGSEDSEDSEETEERRERLRRFRISKANKGKVPWNKGRKHSAETRRRIKEGTRIAMQDPKIRMKLLLLGHAQSKETREKIGAGVRRGWARRRKMLLAQNFCCLEWQNLVAEASRVGCVGQEELQWDTFEILREQLKKEWLVIEKQRKEVQKPITCGKGAKTLEHRRKIAETIAAKWANPEYRERVLAGISEHHEAVGGGERKPRRKPSSGTKRVIDTLSSYGFKATTQTKKVKKYEPQYKDPLASSKLEMIKDIRAQRAAEIRRNEAIIEARQLIAKAKKAAEVLERAAERSPMARASLSETTKLLAKANRSIRSLEAMQTTTNEKKDEEIPKPSNELSSDSEELSDASNESFSDVEDVEEAGNEHMDHTETQYVNGTRTLAPGSRGVFGYSKISMQDILLNDGFEFVSPESLRGKKRSLPLVDFTPEKNGNFSPNGVLDPTLSQGTQPVAKTKKWVRGKLIEVSEED